MNLHYKYNNTEEAESCSRWAGHFTTVTSMLHIKSYCAVVEDSMTSQCFQEKDLVLIK